MIRVSLILSFLVLIVASLIRFVGLTKSPPGFYTDEAAIATQIMCVRETGSDAFAANLPFFSEVLGGGLLMPTYLYPGVVWTSVFGDSITSFRSLAAFFSLLTLIGLGLLGRHLIGSPNGGMLAALAGAVSPWAFQFSRIGWDPPAGPCFMIWGCYLFFTAEKLWQRACAGVLFSFAMYAYPPLRVQMILLIPILEHIRFHRDRAGKTEKDLLIGSAVMLAAMILVTLPLLYGTWSGALMARSRMLSIFSDYYLQPLGGFSWERVITAFVSNFWAHLSPDFLFLKGDANLRHGIGSTGVMSALDMVALLAVPFLFFAKRKDSADVPIWRQWALLLGVGGFVAGIIPSALTWESIPHALRSIGAWPFLALTTAWILSQVLARAPKMISVVAFVATIGFAGFAWKYFFSYPEKVNAWFDSEIVTRAQAAERDGDWARFMDPSDNYAQLSKRYHLMSRTGVRCTPINGK